MQQTIPRRALHLPAQAPPLVRGAVTGGRGPTPPGAGAEAAAALPPLPTNSTVGQMTGTSACDGLTGLARQMCFALKYGVSV